MAFLDYAGLTRYTSRLKAWLNGIIGNSDMGTTADTLTGAIAEHSEHIATLEQVNPVKAVNHVTPDANGNVDVTTVDYAFNLVADDAQSSYGEFICRTTGGDASISDGDAWLSTIRGRRVHTGYVAESITLTVNLGPEPEGESIAERITITLDRDTFVAYVATSGTITLTYDGSAWSASPALYGITVSGTPVEDDQIVVVYVKEVRGTITQSNPSSFNSTGWNLYDYSSGYARAIKYSDSYGFIIGGTYTKLEFSETLNGTKSTITPVSGAFTIPSDGYLWVTGGDNTSTYIYMTWSDWIEGYVGDWQAYTVSTINLSTIMSNFSYGLCQVGTTVDTIDFDLGIATSYIDRMSYSSANLAIAEASGRDYEYDEDYIYIVKATPDTYNFSVDGTYTASDHGIEFFETTTVDTYAAMLFGQNLKDKLRTDVVTISQQSLTSTQQAQVRANIDAASNADITALNSNLSSAISQMATKLDFKMYFDAKTFTSSTSWKYTGLSFTVPKNTFCVACARQEYMNSNVDGICISTDSSYKNEYQMVGYSSYAGCVVCTDTDNSTKTWYVWAKSKTGSVNQRVTITALYVTDWGMGGGN